jgi:hypothetical protein
VSGFERYAIQRLIDQIREVGGDVPPEVTSTLAAHVGSYPARTWAAEHPDEDRAPCCYASWNDPDRCSCWRPVYDVEQTEPRPPERAEDLRVRGNLCGDCAFRKGSPERADAWSEEALFTAAGTGIPFWCHDGMRRPSHWVHPDGRVVEGDPADYTPPTRSGIPYRADGSPGLLCAGWMARATRAAEPTESRKAAAS